MRHTELKGVLLLFVALCISFPAYGAGSKMDQLNQYLSEFQENPNDAALRDEIIRHVRSMRPEPAIPEEARRLFIKAQVWTKEAKSPEDFEKAAGEFAKALLLAPWWSSAYYNQAVLLEKAGKLVKAIECYKLYLSASPKAPDASKVRDHIYAVEALKEKDEEEAQQAISPENLGKGPWEIRACYTEGVENKPAPSGRMYINFSGNKGTITQDDYRSSATYSGVLSGTSFTGNFIFILREDSNYNETNSFKAEVRPDGKSIIFLYNSRFGNGCFRLDRP